MNFPAPLQDALLELGLRHLSGWTLFVFDAFLAQRRARGMRRDSWQAAHLYTRLASDLEAGSLNALHEGAWMHEVPWRPTR